MGRPDRRSIWTCSCVDKGPTCAYPQAAAPVISTLSTPSEIANPITQIRMGLKMSRAAFALHINFSADAIKKAERGLVKKLHSNWEPALERAGHSYRKVSAQYVAWRAQMASTEFLDDKITQIARAN